MSTGLLQLIRISKIRSDQKRNLKRSCVPLESAGSVVRDDAPIHPPDIRGCLLVTDKCALTDMLRQALLMLQTAQGSSDGCEVTYALPSVCPPLLCVGASDLSGKTL